MVIIGITSILGNPMMFIITAMIFFNRIGLVLVSVCDMAHELDSDMANQSVCQYCRFLQQPLTNNVPSSSILLQLISGMSQMKV